MAALLPPGKQCPRRGRRQPSGAPRHGPCLCPHSLLPHTPRNLHPIATTSLNSISSQLPREHSRHGLSCVPPKFVRHPTSRTSERDCVGKWGIKETITVKGGHMGASLQQDWCPCKRLGHRHTQRDQMKRDRPASTCMPRSEASGETKPHTPCSRDFQKQRNKCLCKASGPTPPD